MMNISPEEAQEALATIKQTGIKTRRLRAFGGYFLIVWGTTWLLGFLGNQFLQENLQGWVWGILVLLAWITSAVLGIYQGRHVRTTIGARLGLFFLALVGYSILWFIILQPLSARQNVLFLITVITFSGVVAGVLNRSVSTVAGSVLVTILALLGYYLLSAYFSLWVALTCGGAMIGIGVYLLLHRR